MKIIALALFIFVIFYLIFNVRKKPGYMLGYLLLFSFVTNIILTTLNLSGIKYFFALLLVLVFAIHYFNYKKFIINLSDTLTSKIFLGVLLILIGMIVGIIDGGLSLSGYHIVIKFLFPILFLFFIAALLINRREILEQMSFSILVFGVIFYLAFYFLTDFKVIDPSFKQSIYLTEYFSPHTLARMNAMLFITGILYFFNSQSKHIKILSILITLISLYWLLVISTRGEIISASLVLMLFFFLRVKFKKRQVVALILLVAIFFIFISYLGLENFLLLDKFSELKNYRDLPRYYDYAKTFNIFIQYPVLGVGPAGYGELTGRSYPHNIYLELLAEYGLLGLVAAILIVGSGIFYSLRILKYRIFSYKVDILILLWLFYMLAAATSGNIVINNDFWIMSGILITIIRFANSEQFNKIESEIT